MNKIYYVILNNLDRVLKNCEYYILINLMPLIGKPYLVF